MMGRLPMLLLLIIATEARGRNVGNKLQLNGLTTFPNGSYNWTETLIISDSNLSELEPYIFYNGGFYNAKNVYLRNDNITSIHPNAFIGMLQVLQLDLSENKLTTFHKHSFDGLISVKYLKLAKNEIEFITGEVLRHLHSLETLDLSDNSLRTLNTGFLKYNSIKKLYLGNNALELPDHGAILESSSLTHLSLGSCGLKNLPSGALSKLPKLEYLDIPFNKLQVLPEDLLKGQHSLKHLDISYNSITRVDVFHIPTSLTEFYYDGNPFMDKHLLEEMGRNGKVSPKLENEDGENLSKVNNHNYNYPTSTTIPKRDLEVNSRHSESPIYEKNVEADMQSTLTIGEVVKNHRHDNYHDNKSTSLLTRETDAHQKSTLPTDLMHQKGKPNEAETSAPNTSAGSKSTRKNGENNLELNEGSQKSGQTTSKTISEASLFRTDVSPYDSPTTLHLVPNEGVSKLNMNVLICFLVVVALALLAYIGIRTGMRVYYSKKLYGEGSTRDNYAYSEASDWKRK